MALELIYPLLGWMVFVFLAELLFDSSVIYHFVDSVYFETLSGFTLFILLIGLPLFALYILVFRNRLCLDFWTILWAVFPLFLIVECITMIIAYMTGEIITDMAIGAFNLINMTVEFLVIIEWLLFNPIITVLQFIIFLFLFPISYWIWVYWLKKRKYCDYIPKNTRYFLYRVILILYSLIIISLPLIAFTFSILRQIVRSQLHL